MKRTEEFSENLTNTNNEVKSKKKDTANAAFIWGLISLFTLGVLIIPEVLGIILGFKAIKNGTIKRRRAIAGIGMSVVTVVLIIIAVMFPADPNELEVSQNMSDIEVHYTERLESEVVEEAEEYEDLMISNSELVEHDTVSYEEVNTQIKDETLETEVVVIFSDEYRREYIENNGIKIVDFKKENKTLDKFLSKLNEEMIPIKEEPAWGNNYYARTKEYSELYYVGDMKDNRPHGKGCIYEVINMFYTGALSEGDSEIYVMKVYEGEFKKGQFDGFGRKYYAVECVISVEDEYGFLYETGGRLLDYYVDVVGNIQENIIRSTNPLEYEGEFKEGEYSGDGNFYEYLLKPDNSLKINIASGEFRENKACGECKIYNGAWLVYEGEIKDWEYNGKGTLYYSNGKKHYEGEWTKGEYDGKGTLYNEDGSVEYKGKWDFGDYAN